MFRSERLGFRVLGSGLMGLNLGFKIWGWGSGLEVRVQGFGVRVQGFGVRVQGFGFRVQGFGVRAQGLGGFD